MSIHKYTAVNPLINPVKSGDVILSEAGERYIVCQGMTGEYCLQHVNGTYLTRPVSGQIAICAQIENYLQNI